MIVPFCLLAFRYRLYSPGFVEPMSDNAVLGLYFAIFLAYLVVRIMVTMTFRPHKMPKKIFGTAVKTSYSFFIIWTLVLLATVAVMSVADASDVHIRNAMLWISATIYLLFLVRKFQIFISGCSFFTAFLYLCALEILPTGALVASAIVF